MPGSIMVNGQDFSRATTDNAIELGSTSQDMPGAPSRHDVLAALGRAAGSSDAVPSRTEMVTSSPALQALLAAAAADGSVDPAMLRESGMTIDPALVAEAVARSRDGSKAALPGLTPDALANAMNRARSGQPVTRSTNPALAGLKAGAQTNPLANATVRPANPLAPRPETTTATVPTAP